MLVWTTGFLSKFNHDSSLLGPASRALVASVHNVRTVSEFRAGRNLFNPTNIVKVSDLGQRRLGSQLCFDI